LISQISTAFTGREFPVQPTRRYADFQVFAGVSGNLLLSAFDDFSSALATLHEAARYLTRLALPRDALTAIGRELSALAPSESLRLLAATSPDYLAFVTQLMRNAASVGLAAECARSVVAYAARDSVVHRLVLSFLEFERCRSGRDLFSFFSYLHAIGDDQAALAVYANFDVRERLLFDFLRGNKSDVFRSPFCDWPLSDRDFAAAVAVDLSAIAPIAVGDRPLTRFHVAFATEHSEYFAEEALAGAYAAYFLPPRRFLFSPISAKPPRTAQTALRKGEVPRSIPLLRAFFQFAQRPIAVPLFNAALSVLLDGAAADIAPALRYAASHALDLTDDNRARLAARGLWEFDVLYARADATAAIDAGALFRLRAAPSPADVSVAADPGGHFQAAAAQYRFRCRESRGVCHFLGRYRVPLSDVAAFLERGAKAVGRVPRLKNALHFFRIAELFFRLAYAQGADAGAAALFAKLADGLAKFRHRHADAALSREVGRLLAWAAFVGAPGVAELIDEWQAESGASPAYFLAAAVAGTLGGRTPAFFSAHALAAALGSGVPSLAIDAMRSVTFPMRSPRRLDRAVASVLPSAIAGVFRAFPQNPIVPEEVISALAILRKQPKPLQQAIVPELVVACGAHKTVGARLILRELAGVDLAEIIDRFTALPHVENARALVDGAKQSGKVAEVLKRFVREFAQRDGNMLMVLYIIRRLALESGDAAAVPVDAGPAVKMLLEGADIGDALDCVLDGE
jgi:hypothetical protein